MFIFFSFLLTACGSGASSSMESVTISVPGLETSNYGEHPLQEVDLYNPKNSNGSPLMIWIHGGGWKHGDKQNDSIREETFFKNLVEEHGIAVLNINYRLAEAGRFPNSVQDVEQILSLISVGNCENCKNPILWKRAKEYAINGLMVAGMSAGGYLAVKGSLDFLSKNDQLSIECINNVVGPLDFSRYVNHQSSDFLLYTYLKEYLSDDLSVENIKKINAETTLLKYVDKYKNIKWYLNYSKNDLFVPFDDTIEFTNALTKIGAKWEEVLVEEMVGGGHNMTIETGTKFVVNSAKKCFNK